MNQLSTSSLKRRKRNPNVILACVIILNSILFSCHSKKHVDDFKPMKPSGNQYYAYEESGSWALEMDLNGDFHFFDFANNFEIQSKTPDYIGKKESYKQKLEWNMFNGKEAEQQVRFTILQENCFNFGFANNPFILEVFHDGGLIYRLGDCGTFHNNLFQEGKYKLLTVNGKDAKSFYKLADMPVLDMKKTKTSNMIHGRLACRYWQGNVKLLDKTMSINFNIHPTEDCKESPELTQCMEDMGNKKYVFDFASDPKKGTLLTLSDKSNTFVFVKND